MKTLEELLLQQVSAGLQRNSIVKPSEWACKYRVMGEPFPGLWTFDYHPWLRDMHDSKSEINIGQKSAQMGYTELALNLVFYKLDIEQKDCLYLLPSKTPDASDFSSARFDSALELSDHLQNMFSQVNNIGHKKAGHCNLYIRGSQSRSGLKSIPVGFIVMDELDEMNQENIPLALERSSGQRDKQAWLLSTPTFDGIGINRWFQLSSQDHFFFRCPHCSKLTELIYPDCFVLCGDSLTDPAINQSYFKCKECDHKLEHSNKSEFLKDGIWVPSHSGREYRGFYINQMYSSGVAGTPKEWSIASLKAISNAADEQELYNSKCGMTHQVEGARVTDAELNKAKGDYTNSTKHGYGLITMGVDVGKWLHYEIDHWTLPKTPVIDVNVQAHCRVIHFGKVRTFEELDNILLKYKPIHTVIDANPEKREALKFANRFYGNVTLCNYTRGITGKVIKKGSDPLEPSVMVDRTAWLDQSLGRFHTGTITLPCDVDKEYRDHMVALIRHYEKDGDGNMVGRFIKAENDADHYAHARNYAEIALPLAMQSGTAQNISKVL